MRGSARAIAGASAAGLLTHGALVAALPIERAVTLVPDDGFYYLGLARRYAETGRWTFDGSTTTTGFHLLHAWVAALFFRVAPGSSPETCVVVFTLWGALLTAIAAVVLVRALAPHTSASALLSVPAVVLAGGSLSAAVMVMEWPYVVACAAVGFAAWSGGRPALALAAGIAGSLARSDFAGFAVSVALVGGGVLDRLVGRFAARPAGRPRVDRRSRAALAFGAGALVGLALVFAHTYAESGELLQASARIKAHWGARAGYDPLPGVDAIALSTPLGFAMLRLLDWGTITFVLVAAPLVVGAVFCARRRSRDVDRYAATHDAPFATRAAVAGALAIAVYVAVYGFNAAATQAWYSAGAVVPLVLVHAAALGALPRRPRVATLAALGALLVVGFALARRPVYAGQAVAMKVAQDLRRAPPPGRVGAWNAGVYSVFSGLPVVNLDGLMNDEIQPYIVSDRLHCYLASRKIPFIVDAEGMLYEERFARRGGYANGRLRGAVTVTPLRAMNEGRIVLFEVDLASLARDPACASDLR